MNVAPPAGAVGVVDGPALGLGEHAHDVQAEPDTLPAL